MLNIFILKCSLSLLIIIYAEKPCQSWFCTFVEAEIIHLSKEVLMRGYMVYFEYIHEMFMMYITAQKHHLIKTFP